MMKIYARRGDVKLEKASQVVEQWMHEFKTDPDSLVGELTAINVRSPIIINQMLRAIALWNGETNNPVQIRAVLNFDGICSAVLHYLGVLIDLDIIPDRSDQPGASKSKPSGRPRRPKPDRFPRRQRVANMAAG